MLTFFLVYLLSGMLIGFAAGLFGIGGGVIGIPILLYLFQLQGIPSAIAMHMAIGTSLAIVIVTSLVSFYAHYRKGMILFPLFKKIIGWLLIGSVIGILISTHLKSIYLQKIFGFFLLLIAAHMFWNVELKARENLLTGKLLALFGTVMGVISGMLGLGGGIFMVPYFHWSGVPMRNAIATATACILPAAIIGAFGYMMVKVPLANLPDSNSGYIYWPAFLGVSITSVLLAPFGARLTHILAPTILKKFFSIFLMCIGVTLLI